MRRVVIIGAWQAELQPELPLSGPCEMMLFEGISGTVFDCWEKLTTPEQRLEKAKNLLSTFLPGDFARCAQADR